MFSKSTKFVLFSILHRYDMLPFHFFSDYSFTQFAIDIKKIIKLAPCICAKISIYECYKSGITKVGMGCVNNTMLLIVRN